MKFSSNRTASLLATSVIFLCCAKAPPPEQLTKDAAQAAPQKTKKSFTSRYKAIVDATLIHTDPPVGSTKQSTNNMTILIDGSRIAKVGPVGTIDIPKDADVIHAKGKFVIPGLVDSHIHFFQSGGLYTRPDGLDLRKRVPYDQEIKWILENMGDLFRRYIRCGITAVVDMGGPFWNFDVREQSQKTKIAPRVFVAGPLIASYQPAALDSADLPIIKVHSKEQALELVRKQIERKTDLIKIWYVVSKKDSLGLNEFFPIVQAVAKETHKHNLPLFVHATELETAKKAVEAGADVLVHSVVDHEVDESFLAQVKKNNTALIPTLWVFNSYAAVYTKQLKLMRVEHLLGNPKIIGSLFDMHDISPDELGERQKKLLAENKPIEPNEIILKNLRLMHDYGIIIATGTDAGNVGVLHGPSLFHDFALMSQAGLTNHQILVSATFNAAKLLRKENEFGSIQKGKLADIVLLNSDPLTDIQNTSDIHLVIKDGNAFFPEDVIQNSPSDLAQIQLNAYNARDIDSFLAVYSPEVEVYDFPTKLLYKGRSQMREKYNQYFAKATKLHARLVNRIAHGPYVIDRESVVTGIPGRENIEAVALYEVNDGLIQKVWFMRGKPKL
ncbi:MAG: amidohydrolase family protein [Pseudomonadota bacterium]